MLSFKLFIESIIKPFLQEIRDNPRDSANWLILSDFLKEHDEPDLGELLFLSIEMAKLVHEAKSTGKDMVKRQEQLQARAQSLFTKLNSRFDKAKVSLNRRDNRVTRGLPNTFDMEKMAGTVPIRSKETSWSGLAGQGYFFPPVTDYTDKKAQQNNVSVLDMPKEAQLYYIFLASINIRTSALKLDFVQNIYCQEFSKRHEVRISEMIETVRDYIASNLFNHLLILLRIFREELVELLECSDDIDIESLAKDYSLLVRRAGEIDEDEDDDNYRIISDIRIMVSRLIYMMEHKKIDKKRLQSYVAMINNTLKYHRR